MSEHHDTTLTVAPSEPRATIEGFRRSVEALVRRTESEPIGDGRTRRRRRNVDAVLDAVVSLARDGELDPTSEEIAERAGVSHRSIYRYFGNRHTLLEAAFGRILESVAPHLFFAPLGQGPLEERIDRLVDARVTAFWAFRDVVRAALSRRGDLALVEGIETSRLALRSQLEQQFAPELDALAGDERAVVTGAVDALFQFESFDYLTTIGGLDDAGLRAALVRHVRAHLA